MRPFPPQAFLALFCLGALFAAAYALGASNGLSETHKTVLVGFLTLYPILSMAILLVLTPREPQALPFLHKQDLKPEPLAARN